MEGDGKISGCFPSVDVSPVSMFPQCGSRWEVGGLVEGDGKISGCFLSLNVWEQVGGGRACGRGW